MRGINRVFLYGNLGRDPKLRTLNNGSAVCELTLATNRPTRNGDDWVETADWHDVEVWGRDAEVAQRFLRKGNPVCIEGQLRLSSWVDAASGQKRSRAFVHCDRLHLVGGARRADGAAAEADEGPELDPVLPGGPVAGADEIPF
jgi:single-strand DNA-binding protein